MQKHLRRAFTTLNHNEVSKFDSINDWWDTNGSMKVLHSYNIVRLNFIKRVVMERMQLAEGVKYAYLKGKKAYDVGCGGGLLSESLAHLGAFVVGVDANFTSVNVAKQHLYQFSPELNNRILYVNDTAENLLQNGYQLFDKEETQEYDGLFTGESSKNSPSLSKIKINSENGGDDFTHIEFRNKFDLITAMEVVEHVDNPSLFMNTLSQSLKPNGLLFMSTINDTLISYLLNVVSAEYILRVVPQGTHDYKKFINPDKLSNLAKDAGLEMVKLDYFMYEPLSNTFYRDLLLQTNYCIAFQKK